MLIFVALKSQCHGDSIRQAEDVFSTNRTTAEILEGSAILTTQLMVATETNGTSLLPTELNTTNNILSRVIDVLENSVSMGITPPNQVPPFIVAMSFCVYQLETWLLQAVADVLSNTLEETNLNGWRDLQMVKYKKFSYNKVISITSALHMHIIGHC